MKKATDIVFCRNKTTGKIPESAELKVGRAS
jgi:hypothetical protein